MEHQADLIAIAYDIRLKQRRPMDLNDRELVSNNYSRFHGYLSGGSEANADKFFKAHGLNDFYWGLGGPGRQGSFGLYGLGRRPANARRCCPESGQAPVSQRGHSGQRELSQLAGGPGRTSYPDECYLPIHARYYGMAMGTRVIDFSNPLTIKLERERAFQWVVGHEKETGRAEMDFADWWDKWPGQYDPYMSALETYRAAGTPWREVIDQKAPRRVIRSNMNVVDHSYGIVDICRVSDDADHGYEEGDGWRLLAYRIAAGLVDPVLLQRPRILERRRRFPRVQVPADRRIGRALQLRPGKGRMRTSTRSPEARSSWKKP